MSTTVFYPANPKFQTTPSLSTIDSVTEDNLRTGRSFENEFLKACRKVGRAEKLGDRCTINLPATTMPSFPRPLRCRGC